MSIFNYHILSETKLRSVKPITQKPIKNKNNWFFNFNKRTVKPVIISKQDYASQFYEKYGIIYSGTDSGSCLQSLFN